MADELLVPPIDLPFELTDTILDHLRHDRSSLRACSLVCSEWLNRSRRHLFRSVTIRDPSLLKSKVDFLISRPDVAAHVERLNILGGETTNLSLTWD